MKRRGLFADFLLYAVTVHSLTQTGGILRSYPLLHQ
ncbi:Hypothetical Protein XCAW_01708 [Xanthomonas citri subsp. citri Aw12879]|nr:Hypothetical Protein XCAW_01708 [Xanthomonas citri subsp. citri Aw12879]